MHSRGRVVVVDDDEVFCDVLRTALEDDGFEVGIALTSAAALDLLREFSPHAVILDIKLAEEDGLTFLVRLRAMGSVGQLPVVVMTAHDHDEHRRRGLEMGADRFLTKPVDLEMLGWHLDELLTRSTHTRANPLAGLRQQPTIPRELL